MVGLDGDLIDFILMCGCTEWISAVTMGIILFCNGIIHQLFPH
jgi:hypothetical protein